MTKIRTKLIAAFLAGALLLSLGSFYVVIFADELSKTAYDTAIFKNAADEVSLHTQIIGNILILYSASSAEKLPALKAEYDFSMEHIHRALETLSGREDFRKYILVINGAHDKIMALAEKAMAARRDREEKENNFKIITAGLSDNRQKLMDQTASGSETIKLDIAQMGHKDGEFIFQYQDKIHANEWLESVKTVKGELEKERFSASLPFIDAYYELARQSVLASSDINDLKLKSGYYLDNISNLILESNIAAAQIIKIADGELNAAISQSGARKTTPFAIILSSFFVTGIIIFRILRGITRSTEKLAELAEKISKGDLEARADVKSSDEVGYLASVFNRMIESIQKSQTTIKAGESRTEAVISSMGEGLFVLDKNLNIILINKAAENLLGISASAAIGKEVRDIVRVWKGQRELSLEELPIVRMLKTGKTVAITAECDYYYHSVSGKVFPVEIVTASLIEGGAGGGAIGGGVVVFRDITMKKKIEESLKESEEKYRTLVENSQNGVFIIQDAKMQFVNASFAKLCGYSLKEVIGQDFRKFIAPEDLEMVAGRYMRRQAGEKVPSEYEFRALHKDGKTRITVNMNVGLVNYRGKLASIGTLTDITERKKAEEEREFNRINLENALKSVYIERNAFGEQKNKTEAILNSIGDAVFAVDKEKKVIIFNPVAEEITGFKLKEIKGNPYDRYLKFKDEVTGEAKTKNIDAALEGKTAAMDNHTILEVKGKKMIAVEESVTPVKNKEGEIIGCIVVFRDVTAKRKLEMMRANFISTVSHQLRTPLSAAKWFLGILINGDVGILKPKQKEVVKEIYASNESMINLVNTMLNMSRLESKRFEINREWVNLDGAIGKMLGETKPLLDKKKQNFEYKGPEDKKLKINTDKVLLENIIGNLLINASHYTAPGGDISLSITRKDKNHLLFKIKDNGIGIPEDEHDKIFKKFSRASNAVEYEASGSGVGLYIAKSILDTMGGKIWFTSKQNKGATFFFTLPIGAPGYKINKEGKSADGN